MNVTAALIGMAAPVEGEVEAFAKEQKIAKTGTSIFPNPAHEKMYIRFDQNTEKMDIRVFDIKGMVVTDVIARKVSGTQAELTVSPLKPGTYVIRVQTDNGSETSRFIKK